MAAAQKINLQPMPSPGPIPEIDFVFSPEPEPEPIEIFSDSEYLNSLFIVYGFLKILFNYNIQNNLTIILIIMIEREVKQRWKLTLKLGVW
jgi:hypothetical protein